MEVFWISASGIEAHAVAELAVLAARTDGVLWLDLPADEVETTPALTEVFGFHGLALRDCRERSLMPKIHVYADHLFLILHVPEPGAQGHVHLLEIDLFIGRRYLVTVHGPLGAGVSMATAMRESHEVSDRIAAGRFHPKLPFEIAYAIISRQTRHMEAVIAERARTIAGFEQQIMRGQVADEHRTLEAIFL
ncbi:MAG TPA: CorA family divalent cation transporter, partial [Herpetosiphonaceae bacterium]